MNKSSQFLLSKWYLDCVTGEGAVLVGYVAKLRWRALSISYSSTLQYHPATGVKSETSLRKFSPPLVSESLVEWKQPYLKVAGLWEGNAQPFARTILQSDAGQVEWNCLQPHANARIVVDDNEIIEGLGYVDHVTMSIAPWHLPFDELRWGRFISKGDSVVWLDMRGPNPLTVAFHNSREIEGPVITDSGFDSRNLSLSFRQSAVLRDGPLVSTALSAIPGIRAIFPSRILQTHECKWRSRGALKKLKGETALGWAIHEVVRFGEAVAI